jgi:hypothetical protein
MKSADFRVTTKAVVAIELDVDVKDTDSFDHACDVGTGAIEDWLRKFLLNENEKPAPHPQCRLLNIGAVRVSGRWEAGEQ